MNDSRGCFCMKDCFSLPLSLFLCLHLPLSFLLSVWRASGASLASSQEVKLNCRARLPNDERLWHPGMLWAWTKSSEREKMLAFQLNTFFRLHFFSLAFFGVGFSIIRASNFFPFFMSTCTAALEQELLVGDGWTDGSSEEEEGKRMGKELRVCVCVCELLGCRDPVWTWVCSFSYCCQCPSNPMFEHSDLNLFSDLKWKKKVLSSTPTFIATSSHS